MVEVQIELSHLSRMQSSFFVFHGNDGLPVGVHHVEVPGELVISLRTVGGRIRPIPHGLLAFTLFVAASLLRLVMVCEMNVVLVE